MKVTRDSNYVLLAGASAFALSLAAPHAVAQDNSEDDARRLSTITVTSTQRAESIQDVPIAVTALDPETLERSGVADVTSLDSVAPSFNMNSSDTTTGGTTLRIRGVGTTGNNIGLESSVGVFLDGVYLSRPGVALGDLLDLEQIEVLRGPQGTLFGRNTSAGALNIKTKKPSTDGFEGFANATLGNYNLVNIQAGLNIPIVEDKFAIRISGATRQQDGFVEGLNGSESHNRDRYTLRGQALLDLDQGGTIRAIVDYAKAEEDCCFAVWFQDNPATLPLFALSGLPADGGAPNVGPQALDGLRSNDENFFNPFEQTGFSVEYNVDTPLGALTYIGSTRTFEDESFRNTDYTGLDIFTVGRSPEAMALPGSPFTPGGNVTKIETQTHELRLQDTAFDDRLDWLVGLYLSDEKIDSRGSLTLLDEFQLGVSAGTGLGAVIPGVPNFLNFAAGGVDVAGDFADNQFLQDGESFSLFTHNIFSVTDKLDLTVGVRYVEESKDGRFNQIGGQHDGCIATLNNLANIPAALQVNSVALNCFVFAAPSIERLAVLAPGQELNPLAQFLLGSEFNETFEDDEVVYTLKAGYKLTDDINLYGGFTHGFKSGGFNLDASAGSGGADPRFASEIVDAWEFGIKADLFDGRARANLAIFRQDLEDFQVLEFTGVRFQTFNVAKAEATGFELETVAQLSDTLSSNFSVTYSDAKYPDDCDTQDATNPAFNPNAANLCGADLTNAPEWVFIGGATYENQFNNMNFFANANFRYESDRRTSTQPSPVGAVTTPLPGDIQDSNTKINLRVGLSAEDEKWAIELWGRNVTDEITKNVTFSIPLRGAARGQFTQDPATYGVTLRTKF